MDKIDKMSSMYKKPKVSSTIAPPVEDYFKWVGIIAAGSALGIGIFALKEIRNTKKELLNVKSNDKLEKKMENMETQLKSINDFLKNNTPIPKPIQRNIPNVPSEIKIKKEKLKNIPIETEKIVIVNENFDPDEYEEVEVTDSDEEN
jgi:hypothetical protein